MLYTFLRRSFLVALAAIFSDMFKLDLWLIKLWTLIEG